MKVKNNDEIIITFTYTHRLIGSLLKNNLLIERKKFICVLDTLNHQP